MRWLVEKRHLSVDVRAGVTSATPLMAVVTCCCIPFGADEDPYSDDSRCSGAARQPGLRPPSARRWARCIPWPGC